MTIFYSVNFDKDCHGLVVMFGTQNEIDEDCLCAEDMPTTSFEAIQGELMDTGALCEDYLIESQKYTDELQIPDVKKIVESYGFIENKKLIGCGWG